MSFSIFFSVLKQTVAEWKRDNVSRLAAALAYYTTFSLAPVLIIAIAVASFLFKQSTVQDRLIEQMQGLIGDSGAQLVQEMLTSRTASNDSFWATIISIGLLILGASGLFVQLQDALNAVWNIEPVKAKGQKNVIWNLIRQRVLSFGMVLAIGFMLMVSLVLSAGLSGLSSAVGDTLIGWDFGWQILNAVVSFGIITVLFGLIYKVLPDAKISWSDVRIGAIITALLFTLGKSLIGLYLGNSSVASAYGAAGSFVVLLLWIYYSAQILLFGAEFTQVYANRFGSDIRPDEHAKFQADATALERGADEPNAADSGLPKTRSEYRKQQRKTGTS